MEQFSLEKYLKNPNRKVITRDGRTVRIICTDRNYGNYPVVALVQENPYENSEDPYCYTKDGLNLDHSETPNDLFFTPEKKEGWINLYKDGNKTVIGNVYPFESEELAKKAMSDKDYIATCKIEWEE